MYTRRRFELAEDNVCAWWMLPKRDIFSTDCPSLILMNKLSAHVIYVYGCMYVCTGNKSNFHHGTLNDDDWSACDLPQKNFCHCSCIIGSLLLSRIWHKSLPIAYVNILLHYFFQRHHDYFIATSPTASMHYCSADTLPARWSELLDTHSPGEQTRNQNLLNTLARAFLIPIERSSSTCKNEGYICVLHRACGCSRAGRPDPQCARHSRRVRDDSL
jgi:hypothetical protein